MELSAEDNLRLNVLLAQNLQAVRIDESKMTVHALTEKGEAKVPLNPNCRDEQYIKQVKAVFSTHVMGSPGGYPVFLKRWTRMGQARDESLQQMLLLGEPEAVVAVVHASGLTDDLAEKAWWAMPTAENARRMLEKETVVSGRTGPILAEFLIEFLPFEEDQHAAIESVRLVLQPGLISEQEKNKLWSRARTKRNYLVGFLHTLPDDLPEPGPPHPSSHEVVEKLRPLVNESNGCAQQLCRVLSEQGQAFVKTAEAALNKPSDQNVVVSLFEAISNYFRPARPDCTVFFDIREVTENIASICSDADGAREVVERVPDMQSHVEAMTALSCISVQMLNPIFARTDAIGTVMRKKIKPVTDPVFEQLKVLRSS